MGALLTATFYQQLLDTSVWPGAVVKMPIDGRPDGGAIQYPKWGGVR